MSRTRRRTAILLIAAALTAGAITTAAVATASENGQCPGQTGKITADRVEVRPVGPGEKLCY